jgi:hypothetical protein
MSLLWLTQPDLLTQLFQNTRLLVGGFLARCLCFDSKIQPTEIPKVPRPIAPSVKKQYHDHIKQLMASYLRRQTPWGIPQSPDALEVIRCYHNSLVAERRGQLADINPIAARWHELALRVGIVLHAFIYGKEAHQFPIAEDTSQNAVGIVNWFAKQELHLLQPSREEKKEERLNRLIRIVQQHYNGVAPIRDLGLRNGFERDEIEQLAKASPARIVIATIKKAQGGRPSEVVRVL